MCLRTVVHFVPLSIMHFTEFLWSYGKWKKGRFWFVKFFPRFIKFQSSFFPKIFNSCTGEQVQWNVCHALGNLFLNKTLKLQEVPWWVISFFGAFSHSKFENDIGNKGHIWFLLDFALFSDYSFFHLKKSWLVNGSILRGNSLTLQGWNSNFYVLVYVPIL